MAENRSVCQGASYGVSGGSSERATALAAFVRASSRGERRFWPQRTFGGVALRGEEKKIQNLRDGARDYDDVHGVPWGYGATVVAASIVSAVAHSCGGNATLVEAEEELQ